MTEYTTTDIPNTTNASSSRPSKRRPALRVDTQLVQTNGASYATPPSRVVPKFDALHSSHGTLRPSLKGKTIDDARTHSSSSQTTRRRSLPEPPAQAKPVAERECRNDAKLDLRETLATSNAMNRDFAARVRGLVAQLIALRPPSTNENEALPISGEQVLAKTIFDALDSHQRASNSLWHDAVSRADLTQPAPMHLPACSQSTMEPSSLEVESLMRQLRDNETRLNQLQESTKARDDAIASLQKDLSDRRHTIQSSNAERDHYRLQLDKANKDLAALHASREADTERLHRAATKLSLAVESTTNEADALRRGILEARRARDTALATAKAATASMHNLEKESKCLRSELEETRQARDELSAQCDRLLDQRAVTEFEIKGLFAEYVQSQQNLEACQDRALTYQDRIDALSDTLRQKDAEIKSLKETLNHAQRQVLQLNRSREAGVETAGRVSTDLGLEVSKSEVETKPLKRRTILPTFSWSA